MECIMEYVNVLVLAFVGVLALAISDVGGFTYKTRSDEEKLLEYLFQDYNPSARPVLNSSNTVTVNIKFSLLQIQELDVRSQVFTTTGLVILEWHDERLTWDPEISRLDEIILEGKRLWRPEFAIINGAEGIYGDYRNFQANIFPDGRIRWEPGGVFKTMCQIDITYYPFDEQKCDLVFGAWSYYTTKMNLTTESTVVTMDSFETNGEWDVTNTQVRRNEFYFECCPDQKFSNVAFRIHLKRRHTFYIMNVILPGILTSAVLLTIFFCTPSQKIHIGVASLLSFRLFLLNVADTIPRTSDHVPLLGIYLTCTMAITTMAMVTTVFVLNLYNMKEKPVPAWANKVFVVYLAPILCMCNCASPRGRSLSDVEHPKASGRRARDSSPTSGELVDDRQAAPVPSFAEVAATIQGRSRPRTSAGRTPQPPTFLDGGGGGVPSEGKDNDHLDAKSLEYNRDWVHVAAVCDRFFFWLCLFFIVVSTLLLFHPLTTSRYFKIPLLEAKKGRA